MKISLDCTRDLRFAAKDERLIPRQVAKKLAADRRSIPLFFAARREAEMIGDVQAVFEPDDAGVSARRIDSVAAVKDESIHAEMVWADGSARPPLLSVMRIFCHKSCVLLQPCRRGTLLGMWKGMGQKLEKGCFVGGGKITTTAWNAVIIMNDHD